MSSRALVVQDLRNAASNLTAWRKQTDSPYVQRRIEYWVQETDRLLDKLLARRA